MRWIWILRNRVWPEVQQTWPFFLFFAGPAVAYLLAVLAGRQLNRGAADQVRYFGTWLQLFGIVLVAQGVRELRREFNRPTVFAAIRARIHAIRQSFQAQHYVAITGVGAVGLAGSAALAYGRVRGTTEQRLDGLEREIDGLRRDAQERERQFQDKLSELRGELSKEQQERIEAHAEIKRKLDNVAVGGLHLDVIGLWWLLFATIATNVPDGVAWIAHGVFVHSP
jgi:uncharacterized membrane protein HdeD (DUF308 family)